MPRIPAILRLAISMACLTVSLLLTARLIGLIPDQREAVLRGRGHVCETVAVHGSFLLIKDDIKSLRTTLKLIADRDADIDSIGLRRSSGELVADTGDHEKFWVPPADSQSTETHMMVPLNRGEQMWGNIEISYCPVSESETAPLFSHPVIALLVYILIVGLITYYFYLRLVLRQMNPRNAVPGRVREALDTLAEGLLVINEKGCIVLANEAFVETVGVPQDKLIGLNANKVAWTSEDDDAQEAPWVRAIKTAEAVSGQMMHLGSEDDRRSFLVNSSPIFDANGKSRGALASFEDVTRLEQKKVELSELVTQLRENDVEIRKKNEELTRLATRDPLTDCLNRRSFFEQFESQWEQSSRYDYPLSGIMVDIDHFKSINDNHGHATGDDVLRKVAACLKETARESDIVARYGGEEFAIVLPHSDIASAEAAAEKFRAAIEALQFPMLSLTASLGVSTTGLGAEDTQSLLDQADKCLYFAKRNGRNQVARFDLIPADLEVDESQISRTVPVDPEPETTIPFHAVTALISALGYRDQATAKHCRRVADLSVGMAEGVMSRRDCYTLEIASLLHDIGKVGVPDSILQKTDKLTDEEWQIMRRFERIGCEIVRSSFQSAELSAIVDNFRCRFDGSKGELSGNEIPIGSRILAIVDSFDSMVNDSVYRSALSHKEAIQELRKGKGTQFDPELVERFASTAMLHAVKPKVELPAGMSPETALGIGLQLERMAVALDEHDLDGLQVMAKRIGETAGREGITEIANTAARLENQVANNGDLIEILFQANELMSHCRAAQGSLMDTQAAGK